MTLRWLRRTDDDGNRWLLWPIRLTWSWGFAARTWFRVHGWDCGHELVPVAQTSRKCVPGLRTLVGQTYHLGPLKILFGKNDSEERRTLIDTWCRYQEVVARVLRGEADGLDDARRHWALMAKLNHADRERHELLREAARGMN